MSWPARAHGFDQTTNPVAAPLSLPHSASARVHVAEHQHRRRRRRTSVDELRGLAANGPRTIQTAGRLPTKKMDDPPTTPTNETFQPFAHNSSDSLSAGSLGASLRKERGAIAAQVSAVHATRAI